MYFVIGLDDGIGRVEKGRVTEVYANDTTIGSILSGDAVQVDSESIGDRPQASNLIQISQGGGQITVHSSLFDSRQSFSPDADCGTISIGNHL